MSCQRSRSAVPCGARPPPRVAEGQARPPSSEGGCGQGRLFSPSPQHIRGHLSLTDTPGAWAPENQAFLQTPEGLGAL